LCLIVGEGGAQLSRPGSKSMMPSTKTSILNIITQSQYEGGGGGGHDDGWMGWSQILKMQQHFMEKASWGNS